MPTFRRSIIHALDRPGGRTILGSLATCSARKHVSGDVRIYFDGDMWVHRLGDHCFVDSPAFEYFISTFDQWSTEVRRCYEDAEDYWFSIYKPEPGDVIVDVGAGKGEDTIAFSKVAGPSGKVISVEAHPATYRCLKKFCELNDLTNVTPLGYAIVDRPGPVLIDTTTQWGLNSVIGAPANPVSVPGITLDALVEEQQIQCIDFLKMNIEGAEVLAVEGMTKSFPKIRALCISCHDFRTEWGDGECFRTRTLIEKTVERAGFEIVPRREDPRPWVSDQLNATRSLGRR